MDSKRGSGARASAAPLPQPGDVLGVFLLEEAIGAGGMGAVFRAHDSTLDREVALKLLPPDQVDGPEVVQRFYQEGRSAARLDHENIARVYSLGQDGPFHYIVFEFVEGETIRRRVDERGPMAVAEAVDVTLQMAQALVHASLRGVVHRDVKPSNIIITPEGRAKLVDMGLARRFERQGERGGLTQTGMTLGTFDYISPEQARDPRDVDVRSDLYSLGCTLFHMLTGRPPFPGGTVLQKLLQHQEEVPPDVRELNPDVPPALAKVLDRLMAKDRDRRCQSPEQLVRDLLSTAGRAGIPLPRFETAVPAERSAWERPLAFATLSGFLLLAAGLFYWSRELLDPSASTPMVEYPSLSASRGTAAPSTTPPPAAVAVGASSSPSTPRTIEVRPSDDLAAILATAPHKSVVTLTEDGPYLLAGRASSPRGDASPRDLTIRAETGKRPVLRFAADVAGGAGRSAASLLSFARGRIVLEGLAFEAEGRALDDRVAAVVVDDAELQLTGCSFRRGPGGGPGIPAVLDRVSRMDAAGDRPPALIARQCHFDAGATAIVGEGPADVNLYDCTFGPGGTAVLLDDAEPAAPGPRDVSAVRSSFMAGASPVFRVRGPQAGFRVDDCVLAAADAAAPGRVLALVDSPRDLAWLGRGNLYGPFEVYLEVAGKSASEETVADFDRWRTGLREDGSILANSPVWESADPARESAQVREAPSRAFRLAAIEGRPIVGARKGPFGAVIVDPSLVRPTAEAPTLAMATAAAPAVATAPSDPAPKVVDAASPPSTRVPAAPIEVPTMPPMVNADLDDDPVEPSPVVASRTEDVEAPRNPSPGPAEEDLVRSAEQLQSMISLAAQQGSGGAELHVAAGADLELTTLNLPPGSWTIAAEPGERRPRLRFHPSPFGSSSAWTAIFQVQSGELKLRGLDLQVEDFDQMSMGRLAAVSVAPGAVLDLVDCTISLVGQAPAHAAIVVPPPRDLAGSGPIKPAVVRLRDGFIRTVGDAVYVASGRRIEVRMDNAVVAADGCLLYAQGGGAASDGPALTLNLERVLARTKGGVVHLDGSADEAGLPIVEVSARDSVFSTGVEGSPLFRVDGRGRSDVLADRIHWNGEDVGYHDITTYRADDAGRIGVSPRRYARNDWLNIFVTRDDAPVLDVEFADRRAPALPARDLTPQALRLSPRGPLARKGPDFASIPSAPAAGS